MYNNYWSLDWSFAEIHFGIGMKNIKRIVALLFLFAPFMANAQMLSNQERRHINMRLLALIEQYEINASLYDEANRYAFMQLFDKEDALVYSDMLDYAAGKQVSVSEYVKALSERYNISMHIMNVDHDDYVFDDNQWTTVVKFDKSVAYNDINGILFSSSEYYKTNYSMSMKCVYNKEHDRCYITAINGQMDSEQEPLQDRYVVVNHTDNKVDKLYVNGRLLEFNSFDQAFAPVGAIRPWNDDIRLTADTIAATNNYEFVDLKFRTLHWRAKLHYSYAIGSVFNITSPMDLDTSASSGFEMGVDFGYNIPLSRHTSMGIYLGAAYSSSKINFGLNNIAYSYQTMDSSGNPYTRHYEFSEITEGLSYTDIAIPVYINFDHRLLNNLYLNWNIGIKFYLNGEAKVTPYHMSGRTYGDYNGNIVSTQASDAFGDVSGDYSTFLFPNSYNREMYDLSIQGGIGLSYNIFKKAIYLFAEYRYEFGLTDVHKSDGKYLFAANGSHYPMVYSSRLNANVATRSFMDCVSYKRQAMWIDCGIMFKF